jgi:hypothetical protein
MAGGQLERRSRHGQVLPEEPEKVLLVCHKGTELELGGTSAYIRLRHRRDEQEVD